MHKSNKRVLSILACATALTGAALTTQLPNARKISVVQAAKTSVAARSYGVDVASYQNSNIANMAQAGAQFAIVKVSQGTNYRNPKASAQIKSALNNNMMPMAYHFATFGSNSSAAVAEANYAISSAKALGLPNGSYIACDWETGSGNVVNGNKNANANAIVAFMNQVKNAGFKPLLYSGAYLLNNNINTNTVLAKFPNSLWVASYATMGRIDNPNFAYFPSMNGVAIWQFTDNWRGLNVDGNITLLPLSYNGASSQAPTANNAADATQTIKEEAKPANNTTTTSSSSEQKTPKTVMRKAYVYDQNGDRVGNKSVAAYSKITVLGGMVQIKGRNYYKIGDNQYIVLSNVDGTRRTLTHNAYVYNNKGYRVAVPTLRRGASYPTYGARFHINGKSYYRINKNRYVKVANFR